MKKIGAPGAKKKLSSILRGKPRFLQNAKIVAVVHALTVSVFTQSKKSPGFEHFRSIKKKYMKKIGAPGAEKKLSSILRDKNFGEN